METETRAVAETGTGMGLGTETGSVIGERKENGEGVEEE